MIISPTTGNGFSGALSYIHKEHEKDLQEYQKPKILQENFVFGTVSEQAKLMRNIALCNARSSRPVLHLSISFHKEEKISEEVRDQIFDKILEELRADRDNHQFVIAQHFDSDHEHYHILLNKVGLDRTNINTSYIVNRCQVIADKIEQELNLRRTYGRTIVYDPASEKGYRYTSDQERNLKEKFLDKAENVRDTKKFIQDSLLMALADPNVVDASTLEVALKEKEIDSRMNVDGKGNLKGISLRYNNQAYKGTQLGLKSKYIQGFFNKKKNEQEITSQTSEMIPEVPVSLREELIAKMESSEKQMKNLVQLKYFYEQSIKDILGQIRKEESNVDQLLTVFERKGFIKENETFHNNTFSFPIEDEIKWISENINIVKQCRLIFEKEKKEYIQLMETPIPKIPTFILPKKKKRLEDERNYLVREKERVVEPTLNIWGLSSQTSFFMKILGNISDEEKIQNQLKKELIKIISEEKRKNLEIKSKENLSDQHINDYISNRQLYNTSDDYVNDFLKDYEHESELKDLFWLDKKFNSLESDEEKLQFLEKEMNLSFLEARELCNDFFSDDKDILHSKIKCLNTLLDLLIRSQDEILEKRTQNRMRL